MTPPKASQAEAQDFIVAEAVRLNAVMLFERGTIDVHEDVVSGRFSAQLTTYISGLGGHEHTFCHRTPASWWQHLKHSLVERFPRLRRVIVPKYDSREESVRIYAAVCPHLEFPANRRECVYWLRDMRDLSLYEPLS